MKKSANQVLSSFLSVRKDFQKDNGHSSDLDQKRNGILLMNSVARGQTAACAADYEILGVFHGRCAAV